MKKNNQKGFTLMEIMVVVLIISILLGLSAFGFNCAFKYMDFEKASLNGNQILTALESIYEDTGKIPVGERIIDKLELDSEVLKSLEEDIPQIELVIGEGDLYKLNSDKLNFRGDLTKEDVESFYVIYVEDLSKSYAKYNLTIVSKFYCDTCSDASFSHILGKLPYSGVSDGLKFDLNDNYLACPNSGLSFKLGDKCD